MVFREFGYLIFNFLVIGHSIVQFGNSIAQRIVGDDLNFTGIDDGIVNSGGGVERIILHIGGDQGIQIYQFPVGHIGEKHFLQASVSMDLRL